VFRPSTFQRFHDALVKCKYRPLFSAKGRGKPGPKGPSEELIATTAAIQRLFRYPRTPVNRRSRFRSATILREG